MILILLAAQGVTASHMSPPPPIVAPMQVPPGMQAVLDRVVRPPQPVYPIRSVVTVDDYPVGAKGRGTVGMDLFTDKEGRVAGCNITHSSGSSELDRWTCMLVHRRMRYTPALDRDGNPSIGRVAAQVDWDAVFKRMRVVRGQRPLS